MTPNAQCLYEVLDQMARPMTRGEVKDLTGFSSRELSTLMQELRQRSIPALIDENGRYYIATDNAAIFRQMDNIIRKIQELRKEYDGLLMATHPKA